MTTKTVLSTLASLIFLTTGCSNSDGKSSSSITVDPYKTAGWYGKTQVSATFTDIDGSVKVLKHSTAGIFGELVQSSDEKDQHDIKGYGAAVFQIIFLPDFSTDTAAGYFSEYKKYTDSAEKKVWTFQIKQQSSICLEPNGDKCDRWMDLANSPIAINLEGIFDVKYKDDNGRITYKESKNVNPTYIDDLTLIDVDNQKEYTVAQLPTANLTMGGLHTRTFRWVLGSVDSVDYEALPTRQRAAGRSGTVSDFQVPEKQKSGSKFGLPPQ